MDFFDDVVRISRAAFLREYWNTKPFVGSLGGEEAVEALVADFCEADVVRLLATCRKPCNSRFSAEEMSEMERDLDAQGRTLNLPYCFCRGAKALHAAALHAFAEFANDIECGIYLSKFGGDVAEWHCDANHNFTIQLTGVKEWYVLPGHDQRADSSRGMFDPPRNRAEQLQAQENPPRPSDAVCYSLAPGSVLYLPPGAWHRVVPTEGGSLSVDVRIGNLTATKWLSEAIFAATEAGRARGGAKILSATAIPPTSGTLTLLAPFATFGSLPEYALKRCPVPRVMPYEDDLSDGLNRAASLEYLVANFLPSVQRRASLHRDLLVGISSMFTLTLKKRDVKTVLVSLLAVSTLTNLEYCRFSILCAAGLHDALAHLTKVETASLQHLIRLCPGELEKDLRLMVHVLLHANALCEETLDGEAAAAAPERSEASSARKRRKQSS